MGYFEARKFANRAGGKLISHVLLDKCLTDKEDTEKIKDSFGAIYANEIVAYPRRGGWFIKGDLSGANCLISPQSHVPDEAIFKPGICLFIDAKEEKIERRNSKIYLLPDKEDIIIVKNFVSGYGGQGHLHSQTGLVVSRSPKKICNARQSLARFCCTNKEGGVWPLYRYVNRLAAAGIRLEINARAHPVFDARVLVELPSGQKGKSPIVRSTV